MNTISLESDISYDQYEGNPLNQNNLSLNKNEIKSQDDEITGTNYFDFLNRPLNVCFIGAGYVGGTSSAVMAYKCPEDKVKVTVCDVDTEKINSWNSDYLPIYEPGLEEIVFKQRGKNLFYTTDLKSAIYYADIIYISVGTPTKKNGIGAGRAADLKYVELAVRKIAEVARNSKIIIEKSTVPCKTAEYIQTILDANKNLVSDKDNQSILEKIINISENNKNSISHSSSDSTLNIHGYDSDSDSNVNNSPVHFEIISNPEFLAEGTAVNDLLHPDRVLIGGFETKEGRESQNILYELYSYWIPRNKIIKMCLWSAELAKLSANALLAQRISSINSLSALCEEVDADVKEIAYACGLDSRIGSKFLNAGVGFGGSCFKKDVLNLVYLSSYYNLPEVAEYWMHVIKMNEFRMMRFIKKIYNKLFGTVSGKHICVYGFSYKKNTKDTRESPAINVVMSLLNEGAIVKIYDPKVPEKQIIADIREYSTTKTDVEKFIKNTIVCNSAYEASYGTDVIVVCTEWDEFVSLDYKRIYKHMNKPAFIFDGRIILNHEKLKKIGFTVEAIGKKL